MRTILKKQGAITILSAALCICFLPTWLIVNGLGSFLFAPVPFAIFLLQLCGAALLIILLFTSAKKHPLLLLIPFSLILLPFLLDGLGISYWITRTYFPEMTMIEAPWNPPVGVPQNLFYWIQTIFVALQLLLYPIGCIWKRFWIVPFSVGVIYTVFLLVNVVLGSFSLAPALCLNAAVALSIPAVCRAPRHEKGAALSANP